MSLSWDRRCSPCARQKGWESLGTGNKIPLCIHWEACPRRGDSRRTLQRVQDEELLFNLQTRSWELWDCGIVQVGQHHLRSPAPVPPVTPAVSHPSPAPGEPVERLGVWAAALMGNYAGTRERTLWQGSPRQGWSPAHPRDQETEVFRGPKTLQKFRSVWVSLTIPSLILEFYGLT